MNLTGYARASRLSNKKMSQVVKDIARLCEIQQFSITNESCKAVYLANLRALEVLALEIRK